MRKLFVLFFSLPLVLMAQDSLISKNRGKLSGQWRTFYMATLNRGTLQDYHALATGGKLKYQYALLQNLKVGAAVYNSTNTGLQDLRITDEATGKISRYEEGLFDQINLSNDALFLLGELYVEYNLSQHQFTLGRMKINTPLINPQDGRMIPTLTQGFWYRYKKYFQFGILNKIAPRSTGKFYGIGESIGTYNVGRGIDGQPSRYKDNTQSNFVVLMNTDIKLAPKLDVEIWDFYTDNISNSVYLKPKFRLTEKWVFEGEWLHQNRIGNGGNALDSLRYFSANTADVFGLKIHYQKHTSQVSLSYNRILSQGQFVSPREWGREELFSFQKRERSEGTADNHALVLHYATSLQLVRDQAVVRTIFSLGKHWKPDVTDAILNKYALPDYLHLNLDLLFTLEKIKHLKPELLLTSKFAQGAVPDNPNFYFNKTDMFHISLILNYNF